MARRVAAVRPMVNGLLPALNGRRRRRYHRSGRPGGPWTRRRSRSNFRTRARRRPTAAGRSTGSRCATTPGRWRSAPSDRARRHPAHPLQRRARGRAAHGGRATTTSTRWSPTTRSPRRSRRRSPPSGSTCWRPWPSGSRRGCLADPRAARVFVRIEKLDRIPGALGVEIVRSRLPEGGARLRPVGRPRREAAPAAAGRLSRRRRAPATAAWRDALARARRPARRLRRAGGAAAARRRARRSGGSGCSRSSRRPGRSPTPTRASTVAGSRTELDWALKAGRIVGLGADAHGDGGARPPGARRQRSGRRSPPGSRARSARSCVAVAGAPAAGAPSRRAPRTLSRCRRRSPDERRVAADRPLRMAGPGLPARRHQGQGLDARLAARAEGAG